MGCLQALRIPCEFKSECPNYREDSYVCTHGDGMYCGKFRELRRLKK